MRRVWGMVSLAVLLVVVGVAPAEDPQLVVYVVLDQPTNGNSGSILALPVVNNILQMALPRYNVLPSTTPAPEEPLTYE
ncbi:MAG: hypothetical protein L0G99_18115 [Propionibacteriales bacterium]|nr:hypothetical protein [Propionibacteriales bacterium]